MLCSVGKREPLSKILNNYIQVSDKDKNGEK